MPTCPECGSTLTALTDDKHYRRTAEYRYDIVCPAGCSSRPAVAGDPVDDNIIDNASEAYWMRRYAQ